MAYKAINTMDSMIGYKNDSYFYFGKAAARFDDAANFIPSRLTGILMIAWAALSGMDYQNGWRILLRDHEKSESPNAGWPEAAVAGILKVALGGPTVYFGQVVEKQIIGEKDRKICNEDLQTCLHLLYGAAGGMLLIGAVMRLVLWGSML